MQKRLIRLSTHTQIRQQATGFAGKKINIVLTDNSVFMGTLLKLSEAKLWVQNMRGQELTVTLADIYEIIIDLDA